MPSPKAHSPDAVFSSLTPPLPSFFLQDTECLAHALLNCALFTHCANGDVVGGRIVETESYTQDDEASHSYKGETPRARTMFMRGGTVYAYFIYGMYHCCNVVAGEAGQGNAVLLRALEPYWGLARMRERRSTQTRPLDHTLCRGPGCLSIALGIHTHAHNGTHFGLTKTHEAGRLYLMQLPASMHIHAHQRVRTPRIGIRNTNARALERRYYIRDNPCVSHPCTTQSPRT